MNIYGRMRNDFMQKLSSSMPMLSANDLNKIGAALDEASAKYTITEAELHLSVIGCEEFEHVIKTFLVVKHMEGLSKGTVGNYAMRLRTFMNYVCKPIGEVTANDIRIFLFRYQKDHNVSNRTLEHIRGCICTFMKWAASEEYIPASPVESLKPIKYETRPRQSLDQIDLEIIRRACTTPRELAIVEVLYSTGCRVSEMIAIKLSDIDWNKKTVLLFGKGKKYRTSFINAKAEVAIHAYLRSRKHESEYLFCNDRGGDQMMRSNVERMIRVIAKRSGLLNKTITPHIFRHTTATQALKSGMPVSDIQILLGHANVSTTMIYAHTSIDNVQMHHQKCIV